MVPILDGPGQSLLMQKDFVCRRIKKTIAGFDILIYIG